jgi:hypothetical protein
MAIFAVLLFCFFQAAPPVPRQTVNNGSQHPEKQQSNPTPNNQTPCNTSPMIENPHPNQNSTEQPNPNASHDEQKPIEVRVLPVEVNKHWPDFLYIGLSAALVIVGIITFRAIRKQAIETANAAKAASDSVAEIKRQADIMQGQTAAIEKSAAAMVTENRPWVLIALAEEREYTGFPIINSISIVPNDNIECTFVIKNYGKTPAQDINVWSEITIDSSSKDAPPISPYSSSEARFGRVKILPGGCSARQWAWYEGCIPISQEQFDQICMRQKWVWIRGVIKYKVGIEGFSRLEYETHFCFRWIIGDEDLASVGKWIPSDVEESNKAT